MKRLLAVVLGLAVVLVGTTAVAAWLSTGDGEGSVTAGTLSAPTSVVGSPVIGTGDVGVSWTGSTGTPVPTGYYVFRTPSSGPAEPACGTSPSAPLAGTSCTDTGVPLGDHTYTVVAVYHSWTSASAPSAGVTVARAAQVVTITSTPTSATFGGSYELVATGGGSGNPIVFGTTTPAVCTVSSAEVAFVHAGTCTLTADQAGSTYYDPAPQATQQFEVAKATQTITLTSDVPTNAVVGGAGYTPTATGGGSGNPVTFSVDATTSGTCSISAGVVTYQHVGTCVIDADQAGDADHLPADRVQQSVAVGKGAQAINFTSTAPGDAKVGGSYTVTATGGASGNPVTFSSASPSVCTVSGSAVSFVGAGTCAIDADQAGNADYLPATTVHQSFGVTKNDQTITFTQPTTPTTATTSATLVATASSGQTVAFSSATPSICSVSGTTVNYLAGGTCTINADQAGNTTYNAAPQVQRTVNVDKANQTITFTQPTTPANAGTNAVLVATTTSGLTVTFSTPSAGTICTVSGTTVDYVGAGTCTIDANQAGDGTYNAATTVTNTVTVTPVDTTPPSITKVMNNDADLSWTNNNNGGNSWNGGACGGNKVCATILDPAPAPISGVDATTITFSLVGVTGTNAGKCFRTSTSTFVAGPCTMTVAYDSGTGLATSNVPQNSNIMLDGTYTFTITVSDNAGNPRSTSVTLTIT